MQTLYLSLFVALWKVFVPTMDGMLDLSKTVSNQAHFFTLPVLFFVFAYTHIAVFSRKRYTHVDNYFSTKGTLVLNFFL